MVVKDGKIAYHKAFGTLDYQSKQPVNTATVYDVASLTKICATTLAIMKLYEEGKVELHKTIGHYLPWVKGTNKENISIEKLLLHQAGLAPFIPFYKELIADNDRLLNLHTAKNQSDSFGIKIANHLFLRNSWNDSMLKRIVESLLTQTDNYVYSDNDFIFLGKIVEAQSKMPLDRYVEQFFYRPMALTSTTFNPLQKMGITNIAPTEMDTLFRKQLLQGFVHDPGAAMFGGVAGHAGLFSNAYDLAVIQQMLLNGGKLNGVRYLQPATIELFTKYNSNISRRGLGFDKPEKDNNKRKEPYPCKLAPKQTFGHTGFTGTCVWADPVNNLVFIFLSNRIHPNAENNTLSKQSVRANIQDAVYEALIQ
jgi:beta-N-acetylhexosaminidase